jgi:AraC family transcriptional regulator of adaptative response/methylated-DNA-[protein]-cysteine methyltransferase
MNAPNLPSSDEMYQAVQNRDSTYDGVFFVAVRTTGIFCRPGCPARKPLKDNVEFFRTVRDALSSGYRPCKRCRPLELNGRAPDWLEGLLAEVERDPSRRWTDADLRALSIDPVRVRRWFRANHGMTFHAYQRARRLGLALGQIQNGADVTGTAFEHGFESLSGFRGAFERLFGATPGRSRDSTRVVVTRLLTPLGPMVAGATDEGVCLLEFTDRRMFETQIKRLQKLLDCVMAPGSNDHITRLGDELKRYFEGSLEAFTVPLITPGTEFQRAVWDQLRRIPYGKTTSYERMAREIGRPGAQRAVGRANGDNRIAIVLPCHRVVRSDGSLCGYGGGLWRKRYLLEHERTCCEGGQLSIFEAPGSTGPVPRPRI